MYYNKTVLVRWLLSDPLMLIVPSYLTPRDPLFLFKNIAPSLNVSLESTSASGYQAVKSAVSGCAGNALITNSEMESIH